MSRLTAEGRRRPLSQDQCVLRHLPTGFMLIGNGREGRREEETTGSQAPTGANLAPLLTSCMTLDESLRLPEPVSSSATRLTLPISQVRRED